MLLKLVKGFPVPLSVLFAVMIFCIPSATAGGNPEEGKQTFDSICFTCHGAGGVTEIPGIPVFANGERMNKSDDQLKHSIKNGVNNPDNPAGMTMPPFGGGPPLNEKQLSDVLAYIRTLKQ